MIHVVEQIGIAPTAGNSWQVQAPQTETRCVRTLVDAPSVDLGGTTVDPLQLWSGCEGVYYRPRQLPSIRWKCQRAIHRPQEEERLLNRVITDVGVWRRARAVAGAER